MYLEGRAECVCVYVCARVCVCVCVIHDIQCEFTVSGLTCEFSSSFSQRGRVSMYKYMSLPLNM